LIKKERKGEIKKENEKGPAVQWARAHPAIIMTGLWLTLSPDWLPNILSQIMAQMQQH